MAAEVWSAQAWSDKRERGVFRVEEMGTGRGLLIGGVASAKASQAKGEGEDWRVKKKKKTKEISL